MSYVFLSQDQMHEMLSMIKRLSLNECSNFGVGETVSCLPNPVESPILVLFRRSSQMLSSYHKLPESSLADYSSHEPKSVGNEIDHVRFQWR